jgi:hypothetical protein
VGAIDGVGDFDIRCEDSGLGTPDSAGYLELEGEDLVQVDLVKDADGCHAVTADGEARAPICAAEEPEPEPEIDGDVFIVEELAADDTIFIIGEQTTPGTVARVDFAMAVDDGPIEVHPLAFDAAASTETADHWSLTIEAGVPYVAGESTTYTGDDLFDLHRVAFAYDAADVLVGCYVPGMEADPGPIDVSACPVK